MLAVQPKAFVVTTDSQHAFRLHREFVYLAVILDAWSRKVVGWELDRTLAARLVIAALEKAIAERKPPPGMVHHSDRGVQYASDDYERLLRKHEMIPSMSRPANPYDKGYASYCTSCEPRTTFCEKRHRFESLIPWALRGGFGPGSSYSHSFLSLTG
jgi:transposase InsO family protein